ncbi:MAG: enoyl-CoA hydratase/isomerase family protein [Deltaproteobacteria bacterium]|nr:MAG: enoyl-CoA hydratase/isomerase family protein [Deltaproteobacteria bacterium]
MISVEYTGDVAVVRLDRPPANAIELELARRVEAVFDELLGPERSTRAIVLTGAGKFFSGGLDLRVVPTYGPAEQREFLSAANRMLERLYGCPLPVVAAVGGHAVAAGFVLALTADYRVGPLEGAEFGLTEVRLGIPFPAGAAIVIDSELTAEAARKIVLDGRRFGCEQARAFGVLDELVPAGRVLERAVEIALDRASMPADGYARIKRQVRGRALERMQAVLSGGDPLLDSWLGEGAAENSAALLSDPSRTGGGRGGGA